MPVRRETSDMFRSESRWRARAIWASMSMGRAFSSMTKVCHGSGVKSIGIYRKKRDKEG